MIRAVVKISLYSRCGLGLCPHNLLAASGQTVIYRMARWRLVLFVKFNWDVELQTNPNAKAALERTHPPVFLRGQSLCQTLLLLSCNVVWTGGGLVLRLEGGHQSRPSGMIARQQASPSSLTPSIASHSIPNIKSSGQIVNIIPFVGVLS